MSSNSISPDDEHTIRAASDALLRVIFPGRPLVWIVDEQYDQFGPVWRVTLICQAEMGRWMKRRYRYDIPSDTLQYAGEQPVADAELMSARRSGRRL